MFEKYKNILRELKRYYLELPTVNMSSVDRHIFYNHVYNCTGHFHPFYKDWTMRRLNKILEIFGVDWFWGKKILVLGDGLGYIGSFFAELGADVKSLEGRRTNVNLAKLKYKGLHNFSIEEFDLNNDFTRFGSFDLIINMGLIEVMPDSSNLLECCCKMSDNIIIETIVVDSNDINHFHSVSRGRVCDSEMTPKARIPSSIWIENFFIKHSFVGERHIQDLNSDINVYDWKAKNDNSFIEGRRRFWLFKRER